MPLKSRSVRPPPGWVYVQPETGFELTANTFEQLVDVVIQHRLGNALGPTDRETVRLDVDEYICGLMRGTKALWDFCETRFALPPPEPRPAAMAGTWVHAARPSTPLVSHGTGKPSCPTCGSR